VTASKPADQQKDKNLLLPHGQLEEPLTTVLPTQPVEAALDPEQETDKPAYVQVRQGSIDKTLVNRAVDPGAGRGKDLDRADPDALHAELDQLALARAQAWYDRQATRQAMRAQHQTARQHGLRQRHARKLARKDPA